MKRKISLIVGIAAMSAATFTSCFKEDFGAMPDPGSPRKIALSGEISQIYQTRVNDQGFCNGDAVGIYVVDYNGTTPGSLNAEGNRADNVKHTFDEQNFKWNSSRDIYWKDNKTNVDIYGYYPYGSPQSTAAYTFEVQKDQSTSAAYGKIGGYEASDFLWGKAENVAPTDQVIKLGFKHMMASARVTLAEGTGFGLGEWASMDKSVLVLNTKRSSAIDLKTGKVTPAGEVSPSGIVPMKDNGDFRAIVVPQEIPVGKSLISVTVGGTPYLLARNEAFTYVSSKQHNFTITVNKRTPSGLEFILTGESITAWENDNISHDAAAREYVVIDVETAGTLIDSINESGKDISKIKNLKITGNIDTRDFKTIRDRMIQLQALNLKEVKINRYDGGMQNEAQLWVNASPEDEIPNSAFNSKTSLLRLVLPDKLSKIGENAFFGCNNLVGSLVIPEGVLHIGSYAFMSCSSLSGIISLPSTLIHIGNNAFDNCKFNSELNLPNNLKYIGNAAFNWNSSLYGTLNLPSSLEYIGSHAFAGCKNLTGSLEIPEKITEIKEYTFYYCGFNGNLKLHNGIILIGANAFCDTPFRGELQLPNELVIIKENVFRGCDFSGSLKIPESVVAIGSSAFAWNSRLMGVIELPRNVQSIGPSAFEFCHGIEGLIVGEGVEVIGSNAFKSCLNIGKIVCKGLTPPYVGTSALDGVPKDNFVVEVPESSVSQYQTAPGWSDFKRISAYRELSVSPNAASAINSSTSRDIILRAEGDWIVESKPEWISIDKMSGSRISPLNITFHQMVTGSANRTGEIVFKLNSKDYRTRFKVSQYNYEYEEDQFITIQSASKGSGVNLVFLGDGFGSKEISEGKYLTRVNEAVGHFFNVEPFKSYKDYFNVYTGIAVSPESGIGGVNSIINNKFNTYALGGVFLGPLNKGGDSKIFEYAIQAPNVDESNISKTLIIIITNTTEYGGVTYMYNDGSAISYCPISNYGYPYDFRGLIQHEAGGHAFGKLADEYLVHNSFIQYCTCSCHPHIGELIKAKSLGWYENISLSGKLNEVPWSHFIFHEKYNQIVDVFEGAYYHTRGVYRSEQSSCMNNNIPYFNAISRESIVKRIKMYAGESYSYEDFLAKDVLDASTVTKAFKIPEVLSRKTIHQNAPVMMGNRPKLNISK